MKFACSLPVEEAGGVARSGWPVSQGVPLPDNVLPSTGTAVVLDQSGKPLPTQCECLATWGPDRKFTKWLLVDFQCSMPPYATHEYELTECRDAPPLPENPVVISDTRDAIKISNGLLDLELRRNTADFFQSLRLLDPAGHVRECVARARHPHLRMVVVDKLAGETTPITFNSDTGQFAPLMEVEACGPLRGSVLISGYHFSPAGLRFCPYRLRFHVFAGRRDLRVEHTFIFDQAPERFAITEVSMRWPLEKKKKANALLGLGGEASVTTELPRDFGYAQTGLDSFKLCDEKKLLDCHGRAAGWLALNRNAFGIAATFEEPWQEYPVGIGCTPDCLRVELWPSVSDALDFASPFAKTSHWLRGLMPLTDDDMRRLLAEHPEAPLDLHFADFGHGTEALGRCDAFARQLNRLAPERPFAFSNTDIAGACGTSKTHRFWLRFSQAPFDAEEMISFARAAQSPLLALPRPEEVCASGAARMLHPHDPARFPETEAALAGLFERLALEPEKACSIYGKFDYGEMINGHNTNGPAVYRAALRNPELWPAPLRRLGAFNNESQDVIRQLWSFYLRTGRRDYFRFASAKSRHTEEVDFVHRLPRDAQMHPYPNHPLHCEAQMHYHSATHWSGPYVTSHSLVSGIATRFLLTGDRHARSVVLAMAENIVRNQTPNGLVRGAGLNREITCAVNILLEAFQLTWSEQFRSLALNTLLMLRAICNDSGNLPHAIFTGCGPGQTNVEARGLNNRTGYPGGMFWYVLHDAWHLFGGDWLREWILQLAGSWVFGVPCDDVLPESRVVPSEHGLTAYEIAPGWLWHSWLSYVNFFFDPLVALAWRLDSRPEFLGYLTHRARVFPDMASAAAKAFSGHSFNAVNHAAEAVATVLGPLAEAGNGRCAQAYQAWRQARAAEGFPVFDGPWSHFNDDGSPRGKPRMVELLFGNMASPAVGQKKEQVSFGAWSPEKRCFCEDQG